jgi:hypothetical protein
VTLQRDQQEVYRIHIDDHDAFTVHYLNAYERALIKYMHLFKVGKEVTMEEDGKKTLTFGILTMSPATQHELLFHKLLSTQVLSRRTKALDEYEVQHTKTQLQVETDELSDAFETVTLD